MMRPSPALLGLPSRAARLLGGSPAPTPTPTPTPITDVVIEGDSNTSSTPGVDNGSHGHQLAAILRTAGLTVNVRAQGSRVVGALANLNDGGNEIMGHVAEDLAYGPQLFHIGTILTNDMGSGTWATAKANLADLYAQYHAVGVKVMWGPPQPYNSTGTPNPGYSNFTTQRALMLPECRNPAVWSLFCDAPFFAGSHPAFVDDAANQFGDSVHLSALGHTTYLSLERPAVETMIDASRATSTTMYGSAWPSDETNLTPGDTIKRYVIVSGLAPTGTTLGASISGIPGATIKLLTDPGGSAGSSVGTGSGNGYALYNSDLLELSIPLSALNNTEVSINLTIGSETRTIKYKTVAAVTPATYAHQDIVGVQPNSTTHTYASLAFDSVGLAVLAITATGSNPTGITVGGVAATKRRAITGYPCASLWTVPISATGARNVVATFAGVEAYSCLSWGVVKDCDATPTQIDPGADGASPGYDSAPFLTGSLTVPASGIAIAFINEYGAPISASTTNTGTTFVDEGFSDNFGEQVGFAVGTRTTTGAASFTGPFGDHIRFALVCKAAGT